MSNLAQSETQRQSFRHTLQWCLAILQRDELPSYEECDEMYHALQKQLVHVPFQSERYKARERAEAKRRAREQKR